MALDTREKAQTAITVRREFGQRRTVVVISGALDARAVPCLRRALANALRNRAPVLIDLTGMTAVHRDGLTTLVAAYRQTERSGTLLLFRTAPTQLRALLAAFGIPPDDPY